MQPTAHGLPINHHPRRECSCVAPTGEREQIAYSSLLRWLHIVHADHEAMTARLVRSRLALACVPPAYSGQIAYSSLVTPPRTIHAHHEAITARLVRSRLCRSASTSVSYAVLRLCGLLRTVFNSMWCRCGEDRSARQEGASVAMQGILRCEAWRMHDAMR